MSFTKPERYELLVEGRSRWEQRVYIVAEFSLSYSGDGMVHFWAEVRNEWKYEDIVKISGEPSGHGFPAWSENDRIEKIEGEHVHSYIMVQKGSGYTKNEATWLTAHMLTAVSRGEVVGKSADDMAWTIFWQTQIKKDRPWLKKIPGDWYDRVNPKNRTEA